MDYQIFFGRYDGVRMEVGAKVKGRWKDPQQS
jgi:hypothetical protein